MTTTTTTPAKTEGGPPGPAGAPARSLAYIDAVLEGVVRLLLRDGRGEWMSYNLPSSVLPPAAREGQWLELTVAVIAPPPEAEQAQALRARLGRADHGRDIEL